MDQAVSRSALVALTAGRLGVTTLLLGGTLAASSAGPAEFTPQFVTGVIVALYGCSLGYAAWLAHGGALRRLANAQLGVDLLVTTALVYALGGPTSGFAFLYGITVLMAALVLGPDASRTTTVWALVLYVGVLFGVAVGWVPPPPDALEGSYRLDAPDSGVAVLRNVLGVALVGFLATNLALRLRSTGGALRAATASAESLARLNDDIVRSLGSGLVTTDADDVVRTVNPAGAEMLRASAASLAGAKLSELLSGASEEGDGAAPRRSEGTGHRRDGTHFPAGFTRSPLVGEDGVERGSLVLFQDLTELTQLREKAERAERLASLGRLAAGLAHEIRNPLGSISGSVQLVREAAELAAEDRRLLGIVLSEVDRLDDLVTTMLDIGKPRTPQFEAFAARSLVADVVEMVGRGVGQSTGVSVVLAPGEEVMAWGDAAQVRQVVWNLAKNAVQASQRGAQVRVSVERADGGACFEVQDHGAGISSEQREHLFEVFYSGRLGGVGLGLALVKQIVDAHGGRIEVESEVGAGTTFRVTLPDR